MTKTKTTFKPKTGSVKGEINFGVMEALGIGYSGKSDKNKKSKKRQKVVR